MWSCRPPSPMVTEGDVVQALSKRLIATFVLIGVFLLWLGLLLMAIGDRPLITVGRILTSTGSLFAFAVALVGALGSQRTTDNQNLGLLVLSAALILASVWVM